MDKTEVKILLVEDNENDIELTLTALQDENLGDNVHLARDGKEALEFLASHHNHPASGTMALPTLILLDLKLPKVDGLEVLRKVKSDPATQMIPVVVLSSSARDEDIAQSYRLGANSYIQKSVNFDEFRKIVKQLGLYWLRINEMPSPSAMRSANGQAA